LERALGCLFVGTNTRMPICWNEHAHCILPGEPRPFAPQGTRLPPSDGLLPRRRSRTRLYWKGLQGLVGDSDSAGEIGRRRLDGEKRRSWSGKMTPGHVLDSWWLGSIPSTRFSLISSDATYLHPRHLSLSAAPPAAPSPGADRLVPAESQRRPTRQRLGAAGELLGLVLLLIATAAPSPSSSSR
jgi:hypothetical protein